MKIRFRYRYNGLFILCIIFAVVISFQQQQISSLNTTLKTIQDSIPSVQDWREHSAFMNRRCDLLSVEIQDVKATAHSAYDVAYGATGKGINNDDWMIGKTTEEISRILTEQRYAEQERYNNMVDSLYGMGGENK